ncbi:hypothetical protein PN594_18920 [Parabacteroides merdae]|nr:hypothetical protein [Parabacteroides merdae]
MSNIFRKIKDQQKRNEIKKKEERESEKFIKYINKPLPKPPKQTIKRTSNLNDFRYKVITKDAYIEYKLNEAKCYGINKNTVGEIIKFWDKLRKGYSFVIAVGKDEYTMFYSVEYFNKHVLGR